MCVLRLQTFIVMLDMEFHSSRSNEQTNKQKETKIERLIHESCVFSADRHRLQTTPRGLAAKHRCSEASVKVSFFAWLVGSS